MLLHGCQYAPVLSAAVDLLRCPVCGGGLEEGEGVLRCGEGHSFDIARQGYVNLVPGPGDSAEMVEARDAFLAAGHFARLSAGARGGGACAAGAEGAVVDIGAGTGPSPRARARCPRRGASGSPSIAQRRAPPRRPSPPARRRASGADAWRALPLRDGVAALILSVFAPRNPTEMARVLAPGGALLAVTPTTRHLFELVGPLGLLSVPEDKADRLDEQLGAHFTLDERRTRRARDVPEPRGGGAARPHGPERLARGRADRGRAPRLLPDPLTVTASVTLSRYLGTA